MSRSLTDGLFTVTVATLASIAGVVVLLMLGFLWWESWPALQQVGWSGFFNSDGWYPLEGKFGLLPMLWATVAAGVGAVLLALPLGLSLALAHTLCPWPRVAGILRSWIALFAGVPSVVFGLWGLTVVVPLIALWQPPGASLLAAILILALMILPTIALMSQAAIASVPTHWTQGGVALGLDKKSVLLKVVLPAAKSGILGGTFLALARAVGETMAVLMVAGNIVQTPTNVFAPVRVLTANIALEMAYATDLHRAALFVSGLILCFLVLVLALSSIKGYARQRQAVTSVSEVA